MKRVLITGCDGYIGEHLIQKLASERSFSIFGLDLQNKKTTSKYLEEFFYGDIKNYADLERCIVKVDPEIIIDLAANAVVTDESDIYDYRENFCLPEMILQVMKKNSNLSLNRVIFTSSQYVIGPDHSGGNKLGYAPHTIYGISKVIYEQNIMMIAPDLLDLGIDYFIVRPTNVWGGKHPKYSFMFEGLLKRFLVIIPAKNIIKSYCHISTLCKLYKKITSFEKQELSFDDRIIYGTDLPMSQDDWLRLQVFGLRECGFRAGFFKAPIPILLTLSFMLSLITRVLGQNNPLPRSRVESMSCNYIVNLDAPDLLSYNQSYDDLCNEVRKDMLGRIGE